MTVPGLEVLLAAFRGWREDRAGSMGAAVAYYTVISLAPILLLVIAIAGLIFGPKAAQGALVGDLRDLMGQDGAVALQQMIQHASTGSAGPVAAVIGGVALLLAATAVLAELQASLNHIWKVHPGLGSRRLLRVVKHRLLCLVIILASGLLLTASLAASAAITAVGYYLHQEHLALEIVLKAMHLVVSFGVTTLLFAIILKILPAPKIEWRDVWVGAGVTGILFGIGKHLIGLYIGQRGVMSVYGAAGALVVVLLWVYYSTQILLFGAELTKACTDRRKAREAKDAASREGQAPSNDMAAQTVARARPG